MSRITNNFATINAYEAAKATVEADEDYRLWQDVWGDASASAEDREIAARRIDEICEAHNLYRLRSRLPFGYHG